MDYEITDISYILHVLLLYNNPASGGLLMGVHNHGFCYGVHFCVNPSLIPDISACKKEKTNGGKTITLNEQTRKRPGHRFTEIS